MDEEAIFAAALEYETPEQRQVFVKQACAGDAKLQALVEGLLQAHDHPDSFLRAPAANLIATVDDPIQERPGTVIGPYKLLEQIGEGGMGVVFMAEQQKPIRRKVALKILKPGMDTRQVVARFEAERQVLALMDHPNIARVLDAGQTAGDRPYFVMDLVKGLPITDYCDQGQLTLRERLELFVDVCRAVQHAHQKGIIHRDIKPSNVLVTAQDGAPVVKVIDFGIAKALGQQLTDKTLFTGFAQLVGTPLYMSPEQAALSNVDVDTRSDVYSLGVLLYELLTGTTPFDKERLREVGYDEMRRIIREEEPPKPSTRISTMGQAATTVSTQRGSDPRQLSRLFRGELDWVVMKALEKDRNRRYESTGALAADVQRYLADEPLQASPPSAAYRLKKLARRHKVTLAVAGLIALAVLTVAASAGYVLRDRSTRQAVVAARVGDALDESGWLYRAGKVPEALNAAQRAEGLLATGPADDSLAARVRERIEDLQMVLKLEEAGVWDEQAAKYEQLFRRYGIDLAAQPAEEIAAQIRDRFIASDLVNALDQLAFNFFSYDHDDTPLNALSPRKLMAVSQQVDPDPWRDQVRQAFQRDDKAALEDLARTAPIDQLPPVTLRTIALGLGKLALKQQIRASAVPPNPKPLARDFLRRALQRYPSDLLLNWLLADDLQNSAPQDLKEAAGYYRTFVALRPNIQHANFRLGQVMLNSGQPDDAIPYFRKVIELDPQAFWGYIMLASSLAHKGQTDEADAWLRKAIALKFNGDDLGTSHFGVAQVFANLGRWDEAIAEYKEALRLRKQELNIGIRWRLATALGNRGRYEEAIAEFKEALRLKPDSAFALSNLACLLLTAADAKYRDPPRAVELAKKAVELEPGMGQLWNTLGRAHSSAGNCKEAIAAYREALRLNKDDAIAHQCLAWLLATCPDPKFRDAPRAITHGKRAVERAPKEGGIWNTLGVAHYRAGDWKAAIEALKKGRQLKSRWNLVTLTGEARGACVARPFSA